MASKSPEKKPVDMAFTTKNVQTAVQEVKDTDELGLKLGVPRSKRNTIKRQFSTVPQQVKAYIDYFMEHDPVASWRAVIVALDTMGEKEAADAIRHLAEPVTDPTLTINNLRQVTASVKKWYDLGQDHGSLDVPSAVCVDIRDSNDYKTEEQKKEALLLYYLLTMPMASWPSIAGALHRREEKTASQAVQVFLKATAADPSLTPENLSSVLDIMADWMWGLFSLCVNIPVSEFDKIRKQSPYNDRKSKLAVSPHLISTHPSLSWTLVAHALYRMVPLYVYGYDYGDADSCHEALDHLQQKFPTGRYRSKQFYESEILKGHVELHIDKVVMYGIAGSGKTSALAAMLGRDPLTIRSSTPLMKRPVNVRFMCVDDKTEWKERTVKQMCNTVAEVMHSRMSEQNAEAQSSASPASPSQQPSHTTPSSQSLQPISKKTDTSTPKAAGTSTPHPEKKSPDREQSEAEVSLDSLLQSSEVDEEFVSLINSAPPSPEPILRLIQTLVLDSGGQPQFHELMSVFLNGATEFVYVFKVNESLDAKSVIRYFKEDTLVYEFTASQTNEETLKQCTRSMSSLTAQNPDIPPPNLLFLATHPDLVAVDKLPGVLDTLHKKLREILLPKFKDQIIFCNKEGEDFIFTLNAAKPGKKDKECAEAIRVCLSGDREGKRVVVKVPLRWHALYYKLVEVSEGLGKKVLSREQCGRVAESIRIDEGSCEEALNFFNRLNMLFYFPDIVADLVFIDPQIVLDKVTELVEESYRMSQGKKNQSLCPISGDKLEDRLKFRDYGQVTEKFLSGFESHYEAPLFTPKELVTLLKGLLVFADLSEEVYFMPCLLQVVSSEVVAPYRVSEEKALAVHFPKSGPLMGMFCCTVAYLLSPDHAQWEVVKKEAGTPICLNRNVIQFTVPKVAGTVSLIDQFTHFEIHVHTHPKKTAQMWKLVHDTVFAGMKEAKKTLGYVNNTPVPAIVCPAHSTTPHPATVDNDGTWKCSVTPQKFGVVSEDTIPWRTICNTHSEPQAVTATSPSSATAAAAAHSNQCPPSTPQPLTSTTPSPVTSSTTAHTTLDVDDLFNVYAELIEVAHKWKRIGLALRLSWNLLEKIHCENHGDMENCLRDVLTQWLRKVYKTSVLGDPSWKLLVEAVAHRAGGNDCALADKIAKKYNVERGATTTEDQ